MKLAALAFLSIVAFAAVPARAQQEVPAAALIQVELRVTSAASGAAWIDRGSIDGLAVHDRVRFFPRQGGTYEGTVAELDGRSARVELFDPKFVPAPGTRGEVKIPSTRMHPESAAPEALAPPPSAPVDAAPDAVVPEHPPWEHTDEAWSQDLPLLAQVRPLRPEDRPLRATGRFYTSGDQTWSSEGDRSDTFLRAGAGVLYENPFGNGADLLMDGEFNYRRTVNPDDDDEDKTRLRLDRLSYAKGGTRFAEERLEFGRFLQYDMPEFGVLDGIQWSRRLGHGNHFGVSAGYLPEPDDEQDTLEDLQVAAYYRWVADESERVSATGGYQKTFHNFDADRDLFVAKFDYLPVDGWSLRGTAWIDFYTSGDEAKGSGVEVTQAYVTSGRRFDGGSTLNLTYSHIAFPETDRNEFTDVTDAQLADDHNDRIALDARQQFSRAAGVYEVVGAWTDEDDNGADGELGFDVRELFGDQSSAGLATFGTDGEFSSVIGYRVFLSKAVRENTYGLMYEFGQNRIDGFSSDNDDLPQHRLRATWDTYSAAGWNFSAHVEGQLLDDEHSLNIGFYLQRIF